MKELFELAGTTLLVQCKCGAWGRALSFCPECDEFLTVLLRLTEPPARESEQ